MFINTSKSLLIGFNILSNGFAMMFISGFIQALITDLIKYFHYDYQNLISNPFKIRLKDVVNFGGITGFIIGVSLNPFVFLYIKTKLLLK